MYSRSHNFKKTSKNLKAKTANQTNLESSSSKEKDCTENHDRLGSGKPSMSMQ